VFVDLPAVGKELRKAAACLVIESVKAAEDVFAPVSGSVVARNEALEKHPELVNSDPFGEGWLIRAKLTDPKELDTLMTADAYAAWVATL